MGHEHIERNTDQGGRRGRDDDAATARATARRQRIGHRRNRTFMRSDRQVFLANSRKRRRGAWLLSAHGVAAALFAVTRLFRVSFPVCSPVRLRTKMTIDRRRQDRCRRSLSCAGPQALRPRLGQARSGDIAAAEGPSATLSVLAAARRRRPILWSMASAAFVSLARTSG